MNDKLAIYIDIEGFSKKFKTGGREFFVKLTNDLFKGQVELTNLSIVQIVGDGYLITEVHRYSNDLTKFIDTPNTRLAKKQEFR